MEGDRVEFERPKRSRTLNQLIVTRPEEIQNFGATGINVRSGKLDTLNYVDMLSCLWGWALIRGEDGINGFKTGRYKM